MARTEREVEVSRDTLERRFNNAILDHFEEAGYPDMHVDAGDIAVASGAVLTSYLKAIPSERTRANILDHIIAQLRRDVLGAGHG